MVAKDPLAMRSDDISHVRSFELFAIYVMRGPREHSWRVYDVARSLPAALKIVGQQQQGQSSCLLLPSLCCLSSSSSLDLLSEKCS
jgi:hypothetical protein